MRSVRRSGRTAERRPTPSPRSAPLLLCPRRACSLELTRRRRASAEPRARRSLSAPPTLSSAHRSCRRAQRAPSWPHRRAPTDVILTFRSVAAPPSPRLFTRTDTTTASERRAASTSFCLRAADLVERAPIAPRWTRRAPFWPVITVFVCPIASHWLKCKLMCERAGTSNSLPTFTPKTDQAESACRDFRCAPLRSCFAPLRSCFAPLRSASLRLFLRIASSRRSWSLRKPCDCDNASGPVATVSSAGLALFTIRVLLDLDISPDVPQHAGQPPDRRPSVSLPLLAPARHKVARDEFFSLCGRSPAGAPVSPVLAAPLFASGCAQVQTKQSPGSFLSCDITRAKRPRVAPLGRCPPLRDIETPF